MKNILNLITNIFVIFLSVLELFIFWIPKLYAKIKELEEILQEAGTKRRDINK